MSKQKGIYPDEMENAYSAYQWNQIVLDLDHKFNFAWCMDHYDVKKLDFMMLIIERQGEEIHEQNY